MSILAKGGSEAARDLGANAGAAGGVTLREVRFGWEPGAALPLLLATAGWRRCSNLCAWSMMAASCPSSHRIRSIPPGKRRSAAGHSVSSWRTNSPRAAKRFPS